jgi:hypothetical protein
VGSSSIGSVRINIRPACYHCECTMCQIAKCQQAAMPYITVCEHTMHVRCTGLNLADDGIGEQMVSFPASLTDAQSSHDVHPQARCMRHHSKSIGFSPKRSLERCNRMMPAVCHPAYVILQDAGRTAVLCGSAGLQCGPIARQ